MSELTDKTMLIEHPLSDFMRSAPQQADATVFVELEPGLGHFNVRGDASSQSFVAAFESSLGQALPGPSSVTRGECRAYWLGPTEWLVVSDSLSGGDHIQQLRDSLSEQHAVITDLSSGQLLLTISGSGARDLLSKGGVLDFHERAFQIDQCAQSTLARSSALFAVRDAAPTFELVVRRSFADYTARWLAAAGREFGVTFSQKSAN